jgi:lipopolysaccharide export system protein LptA
MPEFSLGNGIAKVIPSQATLQGLAGKVPSYRTLLAQERQGETREFQLPPTSPAVKNPSQPSPAPTAPADVVELIADQQEYDSQRQVITAKGKVEMRFANAVLIADLLRVNLPDRVMVAEGNVVLKRGDQVIRGERFEYYFVQDKGIIFNANGEIYQKSTSRDFSPSLPTDVGKNLVPNQTLSDRLAVNQPLQRVTTAEGFRFVLSTNLQQLQQASQGEGGIKAPESGGQVNRVRFEAERVEFDRDKWEGTNVRLSNDPFSPPEVEVRAERATYRNIAPFVDELVMVNSRVVLDQTLSVPTFQDRLVFDRRSRQPGILSFGYDGRDRGGLFVQRGFTVIDTPTVNFELTPQYLIQKVISPDGYPEANPTDDSCEPISPCAFGLIADFDATLSERTELLAIASFSSLNLSEVNDYLRSQITLQQKVGDLNSPHDLRLQYNYRERLFNGSLGFQTVNNSFGVILVSPIIFLGDTGIQLSYQGSIQSIYAPTDQQELLNDNSEDDLVNLMRYQGAFSLSRSFRLWQGEALPPTADEGLRYAPTPVLPFLELQVGMIGVSSLYGNGDSQPSISGNIGLLGQVGHFSRPFLDYTGFNLTYSTAARGDESPFLFDRFVDTETFSWGITQQIYGPVRFGVQSSFNLQSGEQISTDYYLEYSRRTFNFLIRYNPELQIGSISLRISDFNWSGNPGPFDGTLIRPVIGGVVR